MVGVTAAIAVPGGLAALGLLAWRRRVTPKSGGLVFPGTRGKFTGAMWEAIGDQLPSSGRALCVAWAGFETNWGTTTGYTKGRNAFNITAGSRWRGETVPGPDTEYNAAGDVTRITQQWRAYQSLSASVADMLAFISEGRFGAARQKLAAGDPSFSDELYDGKYFTLPPDIYRAGVLKALAKLDPSLLPETVA